jgi:ubiquinone/menaquinone biosynthesis C-methylase UbiE
MKRTPTDELLDRDAGTPAEVAGSLADLRMFNRWCGGTTVTSRLVDRVIQQAGSESLSLLDVAAGAGYVPHAVRDKLARRRIRLDVTLLDRAASHVGNGGGSVVGDALALPFRDRSFDLVSSELFVHHLSPDQFVQFVSEGLRVCRRALLINDLVRDPVHLALAYGGFPLYRSRLTRNDAPASVRQAYTLEEIEAMLRRAGVVRVDSRTHYLFRMGVIVWKP